MSTDCLGTTYLDGEVIVRQGDVGECMFAVQAGQVEVVRETADAAIQLGVLQEGDIFGEMSVLEKQPRSATVRALGEARLLRIDKKTFLRRIHEDASLALNVARLLCRRIRHLNVELEKARRAATKPQPA